MWLMRLLVTLRNVCRTINYYICRCSHYYVSGNILYSESEKLKLILRCFPTRVLLFCTATLFNRGVQKRYTLSELTKLSPVAKPLTKEIQRLMHSHTQTHTHKNHNKLTHIIKIKVIQSQFNLNNFGSECSHQPTWFKKKSVLKAGELWSQLTEQKGNKLYVKKTNNSLGFSCGVFAVLVCGCYLSFTSLQGKSTKYHPPQLI